MYEVAVSLFTMTQVGGQVEGVFVKSNKNDYKKIVKSYQVSKLRGKFSEQKGKNQLKVGSSAAAASESVRIFAMKIAISTHFF